MDPLQPMFVRLRASTIAALKEAKERSTHRTLASFVDEILRRHLNDRRDNVDRLTDAARKMQ